MRRQHQSQPQCIVVNGCLMFLPEKRKEERKWHDDPQACQCQIIGAQQLIQACKNNMHVLPKCFASRNFRAPVVAFRFCRTYLRRHTRWHRRTASSRSNMHVKNMLALSTVAKLMHTGVAFRDNIPHTQTRTKTCPSPPLSEIQNSLFCDMDFQKLLVSFEEHTPVL